MKKTVWLQELINGNYEVNGFTVEDWKNFETHPKAWRVKEYLSIMKPFEAFGKVVIVVDLCEGEEGTYNYQDAHVNLIYKGVQLQPSKSHHNKKTVRFNFANGLYWSYNENARSWYKNFWNGGDRELPMPNEIGSPTAKKLDEWVTYLTQRDELCKAYVEECSDAFTKLHEELAPYLDCVRFHDKAQTKGVIEKNGIEYSFELCGRTTYTKIQVGYSNSYSVAEFMKLAENGKVYKGE